MKVPFRIIEIVKILYKEKEICHSKNISLFSYLFHFFFNLHHSEIK